MKTNASSEQKSRKLSKKGILLISVAALLVLAAAVILLLQPWSKGPVITDLGIPTEESYMFSSSPRNPWDMIIVDDSLYIGAGDYGSNSGLTSIWRYDTSKQEWSVSGQVSDEAVSKFSKVGDEVLAPGIDPLGGGDDGNYHRLVGTEWETVEGLPKAIHNFDIAEFGSEVFFGVGTRTNDVNISPVKMTVEYESFVEVPFYRDGKNILSDETYGYFRGYDFFIVGDTLYCAIYAVHEDGDLGGWAFYEYDGEAFRFVSKFSDLGIRNEYYWMDFFGAKTTIGDNCYFATGYLYKTKDFTSAEEIAVPDGGHVTDLLADGETLYVLSTLKTENPAGEGDLYVYQNTIWKYTEAGGMKKVVDFSTGINALSFAKDGKTFYVGLGSYYSDHEDVGKILKIKF